LNTAKQFFIQNHIISSQTQTLLKDNPYKKNVLIIEPTDAEKPTVHFSHTKVFHIREALKVRPTVAKEKYFIKEYGALTDVLEKLPSKHFDLICVYGGLHHLNRSERIEVHRLIYEKLEKGGAFILRDHDADSHDMSKFVALIHAVFNAVLNAPISVENDEIRDFESIDTIIKDIENQGFKDSGQRLKQAGDPSDNILLRFTK
jgi:hypothetical protein